MGAVVEGVTTRTVADAATTLDLTAGPDPLAWNNAIPPARPFAEELGAEPGRLRIGLMAQAPLGIPTAQDCVDAARDVAALLEELGHEVERGRGADDLRRARARLHGDGRRRPRRLRGRRLGQGRAP